MNEKQMLKWIAKWKDVNTWNWKIDFTMPPTYLGSHVLYVWAKCKFCNTDHWVDGSEIRKGKSKSCGCRNNKYRKEYRVSANFNPAACDIIDAYGKENNYNFRHALNGGEIRLLKYYVDGYDAWKNIPLEVDEEHHYVNWKLTDKDIKRQKEIMRYLACPLFIRIRIDRSNKIVGDPQIYTMDNMNLIFNHGMIKM